MKTLLLTSMLGLSVLLSSCQTAAPDVTSALTCDKCKTVWVKRPVQVGPTGKTSGFVMLRNEKSMECPDCESAVATFFKTGSLKHNCDHCGGTLNHCKQH
jgi:hypothetical protein